MADIFKFVTGLNIKEMPNNYHIHVFFDFLRLPLTRQMSNTPQLRLQICHLLSRFLPPFNFPQGGNVKPTPSPVGEGWEGGI